MRRVRGTAARCVLLLALGTLLGACASLKEEKRHTPAELAHYTPADFRAPIASAEGERAEFERGAALIEAAHAQRGQEGGAELAAGALWAVSFFNRDLDKGREILLAALPALAVQPTEVQRALLASAHQLYFREAAPLLRALIGALATPREFAIAAYTLLRASDDGATRALLHSLMTARFVEHAGEPRLIALAERLAVDGVAQRAARPPLADLFAAPLRPGVPVIFSVQRPGRHVFGLALVRGANGRFVRDADGRLFAQPILARATSELPGTITNGHTPRGVFTIVGVGTPTLKWIGPTPYLHSKLPLEATVAEFEHGMAVADGTPWDEARYWSFLPASWRGYAPMREAWLAGLAGRDDIILHGTTIPSRYYRGTSYYPGTPSAGCLVSMENWSPGDGRLLASDQLTLAKAFTQDGIDRGYLVVVEIDDGEGPVRLEELLPYLPDA
jgi:hypothetical protein